MKRLSKAELQRRVEILIKNGRQAKGQIILARIGCTPEVLAEGDDLLQTWLTSEKAVNQGKGHQKEATAAERDAYNAAGAEMVSLIEAIYVLFNDEGDVLSALGLPRRRTGGPRRKNSSTQADAAQPTPTNGIETTTTPAMPATPEADQPAGNIDAGKAANGNGHSRSKERRISRTRRVADDIALWQAVCANTANLTEADQQRLQRYNWTPTRIHTLAGMVEAIGQADTTQQEKKSDYRTLMNAAQYHKKELLAWYRPIVRLAGQEIRKLPPQERAQYITLLGF